MALGRRRPRAARTAAVGNREWDALDPGAQRLLCHLARFGFLTAAQASRLDDRPWNPLDSERTALRKFGLLRTIQPTSGAGRHKIYALSRAAWALLRAVPDPPPPTRAALDRIDEIVAAVDLALELEAQGAGQWHTWAEFLRAHPPAVVASGKPTASQMLPAGVLEEPGGRLCPVWVLLRPRFPGFLRRSTSALRLDGWRLFGMVYALPELCAGLRHASLAASVEPWTPPHLGGRRPLLPGWWQVAAEGSSPQRRVASGKRRADRPSVGPTHVAVLAYLDRWGYATARQVARDLPFGLKWAKGVLGHLRKLGLAQGHHYGYKQPLAWSATRAGLAVIGSGRQPLLPAPNHRRHSLALGDLADDLVRRTGGTWETEREIRTELFQVMPERLPAPPDGRLTLPDGMRVCIQLQLSQGWANEQYRDAWALRARGVCKQVWFLCVPEVAPAYRRALQPGETGFIHVLEWVAPDHSAGIREPRSGQRGGWLRRNGSGAP